MRTWALVASLLIASAAASAQNSAPVWAKPDLFWYRKAVPGGFVWMQVDARTGSNDRLFEHTRLAKELSAKTERTFTALTLPFALPTAHFVVKFDGGTTMNAGSMALEFLVGGDLWRCEMQAEWDWGKASDYDCANRGAYDKVEAQLTDADPRVSPDGTWEALIVNNNVVVRRAGATTVLSKDGTPTFAYHAGSIAWSADSKTLSAYRVSSTVWTTDASGNVKQLVVRGEWSIPR